MTRKEATNKRKEYEADIENILSEARKTFQAKLKEVFTADPELTKTEELAFSLTTHIQEGKFE